MWATWASTEVVFWDDVYMTDNLKDPGNEAGEYISTTSDLWADDFCGLGY